MHLPKRVFNFIRQRTTMSARASAEACRAGRVVVIQDGQVITQRLEELYILDGDQVLLDNSPLPEPEAPFVFAFNKPKSVTTTVADPRGKQDLSAWLKQLPEGAFPIGRLDRDTTGLLLFSNDGDLASALTRPDNHAPRRYWLWVDECLSPDDPRLKEWTSGMTLLGRTARAESLQIVSANNGTSELSVVLAQGLNRQIRRMCRKSDFRLLHLHRKAVGPVVLDQLPLGKLRQLNSSEVEALWESAGGREALFEKKILALRQQVKKARQTGEPLARVEAWLGQRFDAL